MGPYRSLPLRARVDLGVMIIKGYFAFSKAIALLKPHHQIVLYHIQDTRWGGVCRDSVYIYNSPVATLAYFCNSCPPPPPSVNFSSQTVVRGPKVSHHSCYCVILHCIAQIDKRTLHGVFFCKQSRYYIICSLVNTVDKIIFSFQNYRRKEMFTTMTRKICLLE